MDEAALLLLLLLLYVEYVECFVTDGPDCCDVATNGKCSLSDDDDDVVVVVVDVECLSLFR